jgi:uncharacterized protein (DUF433 family)
VSVREPATGSTGVSPRKQDEFILELLSGGMTAEQVLADYPDLEADDLRAMYAYAARLSRVQRVEPVAV